MSGYIGDLSAKQERALLQLRENLSNVVLSDHDDHCLLRWLRARNFNVSKSEKMFRQNIVCRKEMKLDEVLEWTPPEVLQCFYPGGWFGEDKEGSPVYYDPVGNIDLRGLLHSAKPDDILRFKARMGENIFRLLKQQSEKHSRLIPDVTVVFDLENLSFRHLWKPGINMVAQTFSFFESNYPEILKVVYIVKAPKFFPVVWGIIKPFVEEKTRKKVRVLRANWQEELQKHIAPDQLPVFYGGICRDSSDDLKCGQHICFGGEIPHFYYSSECGRATDSANATQVSVTRGSKQLIEVEVVKPLSVIRWEFKTDGHDLGFGLYFKGQLDPSISMSTAEMDEMIPVKRFTCSRVPEDGQFVAELAGTYVVCFDNTYSWLRMKKVMYVIEVLDPVQMDEEA